MIETVQAWGDQVAQLHHGTGRHVQRAAPHRRALASLHALAVHANVNMAGTRLKPSSDAT